MIDGRLAILFIWGGGVVFLAGLVLYQRVVKFRRHRDDRRKSVRSDVRRDLMSGAALFLTAIGASAAIVFVLFGPAGSGPRQFAIALALGGFVGVLVVMATEEDVTGDET